MITHSVDGWECPKCGGRACTRMPDQVWRCSSCPSAPEMKPATLVRIDDLLIMQDVFARAREVVGAYDRGLRWALLDKAIAALRKAVGL